MNNRKTGDLRPCRLCKRLAKKTRCPSCETKIRRYRCKLRAVALKGGHCVKCNWTGPIAAFDFHHRDPTQKDFGIGSVSQKSWAVIVVELEKCDLLCSNCHCVVHATDESFYAEELLRYAGRS